MRAESVLLQTFFENHPEDVARLLEGLGPEEASTLLTAIDVEQAAAVLQRSAVFTAVELLSAIPSKDAGLILEKLPIGVAASFLRRVDPGVRGTLLAEMSPPGRKPLEQVLWYPEQTMGALMDPLVHALPADITVGEARKRIQERPEITFHYLFVINRSQRLAGVLDLAALMRARGDESLSSVMTHDPLSVKAATPLSATLLHRGWQRFDALPVVDEEGVFLGVVRHRILRQKQQETAPAADEQVAVDALVALGELYWVSLCGLFGGFSPAAELSPPQRREDEWSKP